MLEAHWPVSPYQLSYAFRSHFSRFSVEITRRTKTLYYNVEMEAICISSGVKLYVPPLTPGSKWLSWLHDETHRKESRDQQDSSPSPPGYHLLPNEVGSTSMGVPVKVLAH
uniref:Uncharacterized protein n=1 Tax=Lygus hesperus TaxID=30085 RepID=A0A146LJJ1_LYGHE